MYHDHFGLSGPPFQFTPTPATLYMSQSHREGLAALQWGLMHESTGYSVLIGETGVGKSTLIAALMSRPYPKMRVASVNNPKLDFTDMLRLILRQMKLEPVETKGGMLEQLESLLDILGPAERVVIVLDEAQAISDETLEELRLLSNYGRAERSHVQLVLAGTPDLMRRLMTMQLMHFYQRVGARSLLSPLDPNESADYIDYRLRDKGGSTARIFEPRALTHVVAHGGGVPRRLNVLCHNSMLVAYGEGAKRVQVKHAQEAVGDYEDLFRPARRGLWVRLGGLLPRQLPGLKSVSGKATAAVSSVVIGVAALGLNAHKRNAIPRIAPHSNSNLRSRPDPGKELNGTANVNPRAEHVLLAANMSVSEAHVAPGAARAAKNDPDLMRIARKAHMPWLGRNREV